MPWAGPLRPWIGEISKLEIGPRFMVPVTAARSRRPCRPAGGRQKSGELGTSEGALGGSSQSLERRDKWNSSWVAPDQVDAIGSQWHTGA